MPEVAGRFPWERLAPKFDWIRLVEELPGGSLLWAHGRCGRRCLDRDRGARLRASTIKHVAVTIGHAADADGHNAFRGIKELARLCDRHRTTVIVAVGHLETVGLLFARTRAGTMGMARDWATNYSLTRPPIEDLAQAGLGEEQSRMFSWFARLEHETG